MGVGGGEGRGAAVACRQQRAGPAGKGEGGGDGAGSSRLPGHAPQPRARARAPDRERRGSGRSGHGGGKRRWWSGRGVASAARIDAATWRAGRGADGAGVGGSRQMPARRTARVPLQRAGAGRATGVRGSDPRCNACTWRFERSATVDWGSAHRNRGRVWQRSPASLPVPGARRRDGLNALVPRAARGACPAEARGDKARHRRPTAPHRFSVSRLHCASRGRPHRWSRACFCAAARTVVRVSRVRAAAMASRGVFAFVALLALVSCVRAGSDIEAIRHDFDPALTESRACARASCPRGGGGPAATAVGVARPPTTAEPLRTPCPAGVARADRRRAACPCLAADRFSLPLRSVPGVSLVAGRGRPEPRAPPPDERGADGTSAFFSFFLLWRGPFGRRPRAAARGAGAGVWGPRGGGQGPGPRPGPAGGEGREESTTTAVRGGGRRGGGGRAGTSRLLLRLRPRERVRPYVRPRRLPIASSLPIRSLRRTLRTISRRSTRSPRRRSTRPSRRRTASVRHPTANGRGARGGGGRGGGAGRVARMR